MPLSTSGSATRWLGSLVSQGLTVQWLSIKARWEPALIQALAPMADDCLALLRRELADNQDLPAALPASLAHDWARVVSTRGHASKALLMAMVKEVVAETGRILSLDSLAGAAPDLHAHGHDPRTAFEALAGGAALEQAVIKGYLEFTRAVLDQLKAEPGSDPADLGQRCQAVAQRWRGSLEMIARTVAHEVFNRARLAVSEKLR